MKPTGIAVVWFSVVCCPIWLGSFGCMFGIVAPSESFPGVVAFRSCVVFQFVAFCWCCVRFLVGCVILVPRGPCCFPLGLCGVFRLWGGGVLVGSRVPWGVQLWVEWWHLFKFRTVLLFVPGFEVFWMFRRWMVRVGFLVFGWFCVVLCVIFLKPWRGPRRRVGFPSSLWSTFGVFFRFCVPQFRRRFFRVFSVPRVYNLCCALVWGLP